LPIDTTLSKLEELLVALGSRIASLGDTGPGAQPTLRAIFAVNNELGRLARDDASLRPALVGLQMHLNLVTTEVKRGRTAGASGAFKEAEEAFGLIKKDYDARKSQKEFISRRGQETR
jgi:hypothetical protein